MQTPSRIAATLASILMLALPVTASAQDSQSESTLTRIAFGSCAKQNKPQPIWDAIAETKPDVFLMIGDNIYGDTEDMQVLRDKYDQLLAKPGFRKLRQTVPVLATWDDHDYGVNDGGDEYPKKRESQQVFLDAFGVEQDDARRNREGVYSSHLFGPPGKRVQIILLDTRYFRSPLVRSSRRVEPGEGYRGVYAPNTDPNTTILGEAQWKWLAQTLKTPADVRIIASSIQVLADEHGWEMWGNFPHERKRLMQLIAETKADGVVMLSGDRHLAEIAIMPNSDPISPGYPIIDVTSSSLNTPSGNFTAAGTRFANELNRYRAGLTYFDTNFGLITIDWQADPVIRCQVRDADGGVVLQVRKRLSELSLR